jgi:hypothetical protein
MSTDGAMEPSPFDEDDEYRAPLRRPWKPALPLSQDELDRYAQLPFGARTFNPWHCMFNLHAEDGIGYYSGLGKRQCETVLADPTKSRYCMEHSALMGVDYYSPSELSEAADSEAATNLTRLVPKAIRTIEEVMDDEDAPPGIRAKTASDVLDRTGYAKGVDVRVDARVATVDITSLLSERLDALRDAQLAAAAAAASLAGATDDDSPVDETPAPGPVVTGAIVSTLDGNDDGAPGAAS